MYVQTTLYIYYVLSFLEEEINYTWVLFSASGQNLDQKSHTILSWCLGEKKECRREVGGTDWIPAQGGGAGRIQIGRPVDL